jgi:hypothetical protein
MVYERQKSKTYTPGPPAPFADTNEVLDTDVGVDVSGIFLTGVGKGGGGLRVGMAPRAHESIMAGCGSVRI